MRVALVSMPFQDHARPALGVALLQPAVRAAGFDCDAVYGSLAFAAAIGTDAYHELWVPGLLGSEGLFAPALHGRTPKIEAELSDRWTTAFGAERADQLAAFSRIADQLVEAMADELCARRYDVVGFSDSFFQNVPSLALAKAIRRRDPAVLIAFGGSAWRQPMGAALLDMYPFVDVAFSGEADRTFPAFLAHVAGRLDRDALPDMPGVLLGRSVASRYVEEAEPIEDLDALPLPDFDDYFRQLRRHKLHAVAVTLPFETSRGCWWGERSHCVFCGLNGNDMAFRAKSPDRMVSEVRSLWSRYGVRRLFAVDNILDTRYFAGALARLATEVPGLEMFWEVKANLTHRQIAALAGAGVIAIQPGVESLDDRVLDAMGKGVTVTTNLQMLKWAAEFGIHPVWNMLHGFGPDEPDHYLRQVSLMARLHHLTPPDCVSQVFADRFSPMHERPDDHGIARNRPLLAYLTLHQIDDAAAARVAFRFVPEPAVARSPALLQAYDDLRRAAEAWKHAYAGGARLEVRLAEDADDAPRISVERQDASGRSAWELDGWRACVYLGLDRARTVAEVRSLADGIDRGEIDAFLRQIEEAGLAVSIGDRLMALAVHVPPRPPDAPAARGAVRATVRRSLIPVRSIGTAIRAAADA